MEPFRSKLKRAFPYILLVIPFFLTELYLRIDLLAIRYFNWKMILPGVLFFGIWTGLFIFVSLALPRTIGRIVYGVFSLVHLTLFLAVVITFDYTDYCFSFTLMRMAGEGKDYIWDTVKAMNPLVFITALLTIATIVLAIRFFPEKKVSGRYFGIMVGGLVVLHILTPLCFGPATNGLEWSAWRNPRNIYRDYNDKNRSLAVSGLSEYIVRDFYITFLKPEEKMTAEEEAFLQEAYGNPSLAETNAYTGLFKGYNVIFLQLEGIDDWLVTEETMPNLYALMQDAYNFTDHFAFFNGGGSTFNSEFAVNTGFITPLTYSRNAYTFNANAYPYSMPRMMKEAGYSVNAFHQNTAKFYSRDLNYRSWGYDGYYGLIDTDRYDKKDTTVYLDTTLMTDETVREMVFCTDHPTVSYITTYTPHTPFNTTKNEIGAYLAEKQYGKARELGEEATVRLMAAETDRMIGLLMDGLQESGLYDKTMIVAYADHYLYTLQDKEILARNGKQTDNNLINRTPFIIWTSDCEPTEFTKTNSQLDILPTVLNLLGIPYYPDYYIGCDIMSPDYKGFVFFPDTSVYDGNVYVENGTVTNGDAYSEEELQALLAEVNRLIRKNDLTLQYDYLKGKQENR